MYINIEHRPLTLVKKLYYSGIPEEQIVNILGIESDIVRQEVNSYQDEFFAIQGRRICQLIKLGYSREQIASFMFMSGDAVEKVLEDSKTMLFNIRDDIPRFLNPEDVLPKAGDQETFSEPDLPKVKYLPQVKKFEERVTESINLKNIEGDEIDRIYDQIEAIVTECQNTQAELEIRLRDISGIHERLKALQIKLKEFSKLCRKTFD